MPNRIGEKADILQDNYYIELIQNKAFLAILERLSVHMSVQCNRGGNTMFIEVPITECTTEVISHGDYIATILPLYWTDTGCNYN